MSQYFDYLLKFNDTIFIIPGYTDTSVANFFEKKEILCILRDEPAVYKRELKASAGFLRCFTFDKKYLDSSLSQVVYRYEVSSCGSLRGLPMLFYRSMGFNSQGEIVSFIWDDGDCIWDCIGNTAKIGAD